MFGSNVIYLDQINNLLKKYNFLKFIFKCKKFLRVQIHANQSFNYIVLKKILYIIVIEILKTTFQH